MDLSIVESEPEVASSRVEATPKQSTGSILVLGRCQKLGFKASFVVCMFTSF